MMEWKFIEEDTHITNEHQNYNVTTLIQYANKLFRVYTHIDNSYDFQSHGKLEYFNGSDFITISTFSHEEIIYGWYDEGQPTDKRLRIKRSEGFKKKYRKLIKTYEKFMPHEESK
jgi:aromatic ring hydroxylase